jgi:hypothetical protein
MITLVSLTVKEGSVVCAPCSNDATYTVSVLQEYYSGGMMIVFKNVSNCLHVVDI